ncbi:uncharacterized protein LOC144433037 [Glandiceps talaboti]
MKYFHLPDRKLFWCDAGTDVIEYYHLEHGSRHRLITLSDADARPFGLVVVGDYLYWTQWDKNRLQRADKSTGDNVVSVGHQMFEKPNDIHFFSSASMPTTGKINGKASTESDLTSMTTNIPYNIDGMKSLTNTMIGGIAGGGGILMLIVIVVVMVVFVMYCRKQKRIRHGNDPNGAEGIYCEIGDIVMCNVVSHNEDVVTDWKINICRDDDNPFAPSSPSCVQEKDACRALGLGVESVQSAVKSDTFTIGNCSQVKTREQTCLKSRDVSGCYEVPINSKNEGNEYADCSTTTKSEHTYMHLNRCEPQQVGRARFGQN